jgi:hypothetical protein
MLERGIKPVTGGLERIPALRPLPAAAGRLKACNEIAGGKRTRPTPGCGLPTTPDPEGVECLDAVSAADISRGSAARSAVRLCLTGVAVPVPSLLWRLRRRVASSARFVMPPPADSAKTQYESMFEAGGERSLGAAAATDSAKSQCHSMFEPGGQRSLGNGAAARSAKSQFESRFEPGGQRSLCDAAATDSAKSQCHSMFEPGGQRSLCDAAAAGPAKINVSQCLNLPRSATIRDAAAADSAKNQCESMFESLVTGLGVISDSPYGGLLQMC